jgi:hypothetical protein
MSLCDYLSAAIPFATALPTSCATVHGAKDRARRKTMTPQERKLIDELFDRLASLENGPRDPDAVKAINEGLERAPNALYPMVQTVLIQDEALKRANARIQELEGGLGIQPGQPAQQPSFLDQMRDTLFSKSGQSQGSVPSVRPGAQSPWGNAAQQGAAFNQPQGGAPWNAQAQPQQSPGFGGGGGSFLGTAAATAAGVVGGALLMNSIRGMFGGGDHQRQAFGDTGSERGTPWGGGNDSGSDLARQAGVNDMGGGGRSGLLDSDSSQRAGLFDSSPDNDVAVDDNDFDVGGDFGGDGGSDSA